MPNFISPIRNPEPILKWDKFGVVRPLNIDPSGKPHRGVDIRDIKKDNTVIASESGTVVISDPNKGSYMDIDHGGGWRTRYVHLLQRNFGVGTRVKKGEIIGRFGVVGISTGSHLHFEIMQNNLPVDPQLYIDFTKKETIINQNMIKQPPIQEVLSVVLHGAKEAAKRYLPVDFTELDKEAKVGKPFEVGFGILAKIGDKYKGEIGKLKAAHNSEKDSLSDQLDEHKRLNAALKLKLQLAKEEIQKERPNSALGQDLLRRLTSRKLWATVIGIILILAPQYQDQVVQIATIVGAYIGVEGVADIIKESKN